MENILFIEISLVVAVAFLIASLMRLLKQPLIISYIVSGLVLGPYVFDAIQSDETLHVVSDLGIAMLLFIVGIGLNPKKIKEVGWGSTTIGLGQVFLTACATFVLAYVFGFPLQESFYIAMAMTFSSTIVILKILSDKNHLGRLYGKIALGFLIVQDLVATGLLIYVASLDSVLPLWVSAAEIFSWLLLIGMALWIISQHVLPRLYKFFASSQEYLFLFAMAFGLGVATLVASTGLSIEVGALLAGVALSTQVYAQEISSRLRPLRDFFILFFFIMLGANLDLSTISSVLWPTIGFSAFVLLVNPLIVMGLSGWYGYKKRTSFQMAATAGQVSEFSLIFILLALELGQVSPEIVTLVTMTSLITIAGSTYMMRYDEALYDWLEDWLDIFEREKTRNIQETEDIADIYLFGYARSGQSFVDSFRELGHSFKVVDYDPDIVDTLREKEVDHHYGDVSDVEFLDEISVSQARLVISTVDDFETNLFLVTYLTRKNPDIIVVVYSEYPDKAATLYEHGASYVIMPHFLGNEHVLNMVDGNEITDKNFFDHRDDHLRYLENRLE